MDGNDQNKEYASYIESYGKEMADYVMHMLYHEQTLLLPKDGQGLLHVRKGNKICCLYDMVEVMKEKSI